MSAVAAKFLALLTSTATAPVGQALFEQTSATATTTGTFNVPAGVESIHVCGAGRGGMVNGSRHGGSLSYRNNIPVTPLEPLTWECTPNYTRLLRGAVELLRADAGTIGGLPYFIAGQVSFAGGRQGAVSGGAGSGGPGGAAGYSGNGGDGGDGGASNAGQNGSGGGGGGGGNYHFFGASSSYGGAGGVGLFGEGANGVGGAGTNVAGTARGTGGSGGADGSGTTGGKYGGGAANGGQPGIGGLRIIWGEGRAWPSTLVEDRHPDAGQTVFTSVNRSGTFNWTPLNVTNISAVLVGQGGPGYAAGSTGDDYGGGGGGLSYRNDIVIPAGATVSVVVNSVGVALRVNSVQVLFANHTILNGTGGGAAWADAAANNAVSYAGGRGANRNLGGGGGAAGYAGNGGDAHVGQTANGSPAAPNSGGGGGGATAGPGGGVGLKGIGDTGAGGIYNGIGTLKNGQPGSGGELNPGSTTNYGGNYGGGNRGGANSVTTAGSWGARIIWGEGRNYPNNAGDYVE